MKKIKAAGLAALIVAALAVMIPSVGFSMQTAGSDSCGGSFVPTLNCLIPGVWSFSTAPTVTGGGTLVSTTATQTLTNKTLSSPTINAATIASSTISAPTITSPTISAVTNSDYRAVAADITYDATVTPATITGMSWTVVAGGTYIFDAELPTTMTTVGGLTVSFKLTTATLTSIRYNTYAATASDNTTAVSTTGTTTTDATKMFDSKTAAYTKVRVFGSFVVNAGGTFALQGTQNTSATGADVSKILIGGTVKLIRVA